MKIERNRERSLRRQLEYIIYYVKVYFLLIFFLDKKVFNFSKKLEKRRRERQRIQSLEFYETSPNLYRHRTPDSHFVSSRIKKK